MFNVERQSTDLSPDTDTAAPPDFDPRRYPVIGQHFYGIPRPWRHVGSIVGAIVAQLADEPEDQAA